MADMDIRAKESSRRSRSDLVVVIGTQVFLFECKMLKEGIDKDQTASEAIGQIKARGNADKYRDGISVIYLIGVVFDGDARNLAILSVERD